jgi:bacterial/archaeal transporter family protein
MKALSRFRGVTISIMQGKRKKQNGFGAAKKISDLLLDMVEITAAMNGRVANEQDSRRWFHTVTRISHYTCVTYQSGQLKNRLVRRKASPVLIFNMASWFWYAVVAAVLYGAHQIFTRLAADRIGEGLGGFVVEATAALSILLYLAFLWFAGRWDQKSSGEGIFYSLLTGVCVGAGTIAFFLLFQKGGPLSAVPIILAVGAAMMAVAGILFFREAVSWQRLTGIILAIVGLFLLRR